jgi:putative FmdB family regulatory protein
MPIFEYKCDKCDKVEDKLVKFAEEENDFECECENKGILKRVDKIHNACFHLKGRWYKTTKSY